MSEKPNEIFFDGFRLNFVEGCLFRGDQIVSLSRRDYTLLTVLVESAGQVVQKAYLLKRVWPGKEVEPSNLVHAVTSLRNRLGVRSDGQAYIETIPGIGYRLLLPAPSETLFALPEPKVEVSPEREVEPHLEPTRVPAYRRLANWRNGAALALTGAVAAATLLSTHRPFSVEKTAGAQILTAPDLLPWPRLITTIPLESLPSAVYLQADRHELYVSESATNFVIVIDTNSNRVCGRIAVGPNPYTLASANGRQLYIALQRGGVGVIDTATHAYQRVSSLTYPVLDLAVTSDGKSAYLAAGYHGVMKLNLATGSVTTISAAVYAQAIALNPKTHQLYVSYQSGGPGGWRGHDAIGYFDTENAQVHGVVKGFANVGECLTASPDGSQIWENGADACDSPNYDHIGCPATPAGLLNILETQSKLRVRPVAVRGARLMCTTFLPDGESAAVGTSDYTLFLRKKDASVIASLPIGSTGKIAFTSDGLKAYSPVQGKPKLAVVQVGGEVQVLHLSNRDPQDQTIQIAIMASPEFSAKSVDPQSLTLAGVPPQRSANGLPLASVSGVTGHPGECLLIRFKLPGKKRESPLILHGRTYSGMPIDAKIDPLDN